MYAGFSPEGHIVTVDYEYIVRAYDAEHGTEVGLFKEAIILGDIVSSSDGRYFASVEVAWCFDPFDPPNVKEEGDVWLISIREWETQKVVQTLDHAEQLRSVLFSPDCRILALVVGGVIQLWDWRLGKLVANLEELTVVSKVEDDPGIMTPNFIHPTAFGPDGRYLAAVAADTVYIWDLDSRELIRLEEDYDPVSSIAFSPDGRLLAIGGAGRIRIRHFPTGELIRTLEVTDPWIMNMVFSPDGRYLKSENGMRVWLWKAETGDLLWVSRAPNGQIKWAAFGPDSRQLIARYGSAHIIRWRLDNDGMPTTTELLSHQSWIPAPSL